MSKKGIVSLQEYASAFLNGLFLVGKLTELPFRNLYAGCIQTSNFDKLELFRVCGFLPSHKHGSTINYISQLCHLSS